MKIKVIIVILAVAAIGLVIALLAIKKQGAAQHATDLTAMNALSNDVLNAQGKINDLNDVNLSLSNNLTAARGQVADLSNHLATTSATLAASQANLASAKEQITGLNSRVSDLEAQNQTLDGRLGELTNAMTQLNAQIADTQQKLAHSKANNDFLQKALQEQMAQRAELEHKFDDLDALRQQVRKIKGEMFVARRLQLDRYNTAGKKGAELLVLRRDHPYTPPPPVATPAATSLNVEIGSDGSVRVIPPLGGPTNSAAH